MDTEKLFDAIDEAVKSVNRNERTLESVVTEFGLREWAPGKYLHPRWGWPIEYHESVGYYLCY